jgi:hypothetical protein
MYSDYKPFRNSLRKQNLYAGLACVWKHMSRFGDSQSGHLQSLAHYPADWELELLAREIILNCAGKVVPSNGAKLTFDFGQAVNHIRRISDAISEKTIHSPEDALNSMHPLIHQQISWQDDASLERILRYAKIMQHGSLAKIIEPALGISIADFYKMGFAVAGSISKGPKVLSSTYKVLPGISLEVIKKFFKLVSTDIESLRKETRNANSFDQNWAFTYNPLRGTPLVYDASEPEKLFGISEKLLIWRITDGLYYDIYHLRGFSEAWGEAFDCYIGDVLKVALPSSLFNIRKPLPYEIAKGKTHHGTDWLVSDTTGHIFVECKTKRLRLDAKLSSENSFLEEDIKTLAKCFVQNYKNINDAFNDLLAGAFKANGLPAFCVVVTLENWRLDLPKLKDQLDSLIQEGVSLEKLPPSIIKDYPYMLLSTQQFERHVQDVAQHGIYDSLMPDKNISRGGYRPLFPYALGELLPDIAEYVVLDQFKNSNTH